MMRRYISVIMTFIVITVSCVGCGDNSVSQNQTVTNEDDYAVPTETVADPVEKEVLTEGNLKDNLELYGDTKEDSVIKMYLTVSSGNEADSSNHTWTEVSTYSAEYYTSKGVDRYKVEGILQIDEGEGITEDSFGYDEVVPNVSVQVRGQTSSRSDIKNYKVRIKDGKGSFRGQRTLNLNKHLGDPYRFVNKTCYDMIDEIPQLLGGRTQFVNLWVCDTTEGGNNQFVDYGLYTMVEQVNKTYLKNRGLDENGQLYKVTFFEWNKYEAISIPYDSDEFDEDAFNKLLEIKGDKDNAKINEVVDDIANTMKPIEEIVEEHFDAENICYWMAINILVGNYDSGARNLFLYSPLNSEKFYMICWDLDASFRRGYMDSKNYPEGLSWERGMSQYLGLTLISRMMKETKYRDMLAAAVDDLYNNVVSPDKIEKKVDKYKEVTVPFLYGGADSGNAKIDYPLYETLTEGLDEEVENNYRIFKENLKCPWPFFIATPEIEDGELLINWDISYDVNGEEVEYSYKLARDYNFEDVICEDTGIIVPSISVDLLDPGRYYLRVTSKNESGYTQDCFDYLSVKGQGKVYACIGFDVKEDGTIEAITRIENP